MAVARDEEMSDSETVLVKENFCFMEQFVSGILILTTGTSVKNTKLYIRKLLIEYHNYSHLQQVPVILWRYGLIISDSVIQISRHPILNHKYTHFY